MKTTSLLLILLFYSCILVAQDLEPTDDKALVKFNLVDGIHNPIPNAKLVLIGAISGDSFPANIDEMGNTQLLVPEGDRYSIYCEIPGEPPFTYDEPMMIPKEKGAVVYTSNLAYMVREFTLQNIEFDVDKYSIRPVSFAELDMVYELLSFDLSIRIMITGHTDDDGSDEHNQTLSENRAKAVKDYLVDKGIDGSRIETQGFGESQPVVPNDSDENKQRNRRIVINLID